MERPKEFLVFHALEKSKAVWEYEIEELRSDSVVFTGEELSLVQNFLEKKALHLREKKFI